MSELEPKLGGLERYTPARVTLARAGTSIGTAAQLQFQLDHARARDAVHDAVDFQRLAVALRKRGMPTLTLESAVPRGADSRSLYLRRPDLGRSLSTESSEALASTDTSEPDIAFIIADGLSALAIERNALPLLDALLPLLSPESWQGIFLSLVSNARVAIGDAIGGLLRARLSILLIGERPGLSSPDSLGVYLTSNPSPGKTDADRNCISNIRPGGLGYEEAAHRIVAYRSAAARLGGTGFALKDSVQPSGKVLP